MDAQSDRRPYEAPVLRVVGTVAELTKHHIKRSGPDDFEGETGTSHGDSLKP